MKITVTKIKKELINKHSWDECYLMGARELLIKDTLKVINNILKEQKGISIK